MYRSSSKQQWSTSCEFVFDPIYLYRSYSVRERTWAYWFALVPAILFCSRYVHFFLGCSLLLLVLHHHRFGRFELVASTTSCKLEHTARARGREVELVEVKLFLVLPLHTRYLRTLIILRLVGCFVFTMIWLDLIEFSWFYRKSHKLSKLTFNETGLSV